MQKGISCKKSPTSTANLILKIDALKLQWRKRLKAIRQEISPLRRKEASLKAFARLMLLIEQRGLALSFASFGTEIDLWPLNQALMKQGNLVLPRVADEEIHLYHVDHLSHLEPHSWGYLEPIPSLCRRVDLSIIKTALIPGLGFDLTTRYRLGYGGGHYDRLLADALHTESWGIGFIEQAVEELPYDQGDIPLNQIYLF